MVPLLKAITWEECKRFFSSVFIFCKFKVTVIVNLYFTDYALKIRLLNCSKLAINWKKHWCHSFPTWHHRQIFLKIVLFLLLSLVTGPSFMPISSLVLELQQFCFIRDWQEIGKSKIPPSEFRAVSSDCGKSEIPHLTQIFPIKYYWMFQNARVTAFTVSELLRKIKPG